MKILNWFSNKNDDSTKEAEKLGKFYVFLKRYIEYLKSTGKEIQAKIKEIKIQTSQNLKEEKLVRELWILRYSITYIWFFNLKPPVNQSELNENITLINHAFKIVLVNNGKFDYSTRLNKGFAEYIGTDKLNFSNLKKFLLHFNEKFADKITRIAFDCTEGRLSGELYDFVIELIMTTIQKDQKAFELSDSVSLTKEDFQNIKNTINEMKPTQGDIKDIIDSLQCPEK